MEISNARYNEAGDTIRVTIDGIVRNVPTDPDNRDYQAILEWVAEGNTIED